VAYTITLTNGTVLTTVMDQTVDTTTPLVLIGRNYAGYGQYVANDLVHLLENFANTSPPVNPLVGQIWWSSVNKALEVWDGTSWHYAGLPTDGVLDQTNLTLKNGSLSLINTACPSGQQRWRIRVSNDPPYVGMLVFEMMSDAGDTILATVMALDGVHNLIKGLVTAAQYS